MLDALDRTPIQKCLLIWLVTPRNGDGTQGASNSVLVYYLNLYNLTSRDNQLLDVAGNAGIARGNMRHECVESKFAYHTRESCKATVAPISYSNRLKHCMSESTSSYSARLYVYSSSIFWTTQRIAELVPVSKHLEVSGSRNIPNHNQRICNDVGDAEPEGGEAVVRNNIFENHDSLPWGAMSALFNRERPARPIHTTLPARPPAIRANPRNKTSLAFHATPLPE